MSEIIEVRRSLHEGNNQRAAELRRMFKESSTLVVELVSSPGAGKTALLEMTVESLQGSVSAAVLLGDVATTKDAERIREAGAVALQIFTGGACHFDAHLVGDGLQASGLELPNILFLENVSNLVCPASYDLGADFKVVLLSAPEGEDKPLKYPAIFSRAAVCLLTKTDLLSHLPFSPETALEHIQLMNPDAQVIATSAMDGTGIQEWCHLLERELKTKGVHRG